MGGVLGRLMEGRVGRGSHSSERTAGGMVGGRRMEGSIIMVGEEKCMVDVEELLGMKGNMVGMKW